MRFYACGCSYFTTLLPYKSIKKLCVCNIVSVSNWFSFCFSFELFRVMRMYIVPEAPAQNVKECVLEFSTAQVTPGKIGESTMMRYNEH